VVEYVELLKAALEAAFEKIDRKYEQRFWALAQPVFFDSRKKMERRMDDFARSYAETRDPKLKAELEELR
jgi:hypothetical protein